MCSLLQCIVLLPGTLRGVCPCLWSRGPATAEALRRLRSRGSHIDLADGLETGSPYFHLHSPGLALSRGGSLRCSSSPLSESALICSSFSPRRFILFVPSARVLPRLSGEAPIVFQLLIQECHFSYSPKESESKWRSRPKTDLRIIIFALGAKRINIGFLPSALHSRPD